MKSRKRGNRQKSDRWVAKANPKGTHWIVVNDALGAAAMFFDKDHGKTLAREYAQLKNGKGVAR